MTRKQLLWARILLGVYLLVLLVLCFANFSSIPEVKKQLFGIPMDKVVHFCMFFPFPILAFLSFDRYTETVSRTLLLVGATFLVGILPILFLVPAVGIMSLWAELKAFLLPCLLAAVPVTVLVMAASGLVTQRVQRLGKKKGGESRGE